MSRYPAHMTTDQVCHELGISRSTLRRRMKSGDLKLERVPQPGRSGKEWRYSGASLEALLTAQARKDNPFAGMSLSEIGNYALHVTAQEQANV